MILDDHDPRFVALDDFGSIPDDPAAQVPDAHPFAVSIDEFIAQEVLAAPPLLGTEEEAIFPAGGLILVAGQAGIGKTTLVLDAVFHLVSGLPWLDIPCERPLSVLIVENEGPREQFRRKLAAKRKRWSAPIDGELNVQTWRWGSFSLTDSDAAARLGGFCEDHAVDLIVGDPLGTLGMEGVGSPEDTRAFVKRLMPLGLTSHRAFLFLAHFRKDKAADEIDQISGAWGPHLDTLLVVKQGRKDQVRLSFPKLRWSANEHKPIILNRVRATQAFEFDHEEGDPRALIGEIAEWLEAHPNGQTASEISKAISGPGTRRTTIEDILKGNEHLFCSYTGEEALERGRKNRKAVVWALAPDAGQVGQDDQKSLQTGINGGVPDDPPSIEGGREEGTQTPADQPGLFAVPDPDLEELEWR